MTSNEDLPRAPARESEPVQHDAEQELAFRRSLRASRERRTAAAVSRRWSVRRRSSIALAAIATVAMAGGAVAQGGGSAAAAPQATVGSLAAGAQGAAVQALQLKLGIAADGAYGPQTRRAVRRFQRENGLQADGVAGAATLRALGLTGLPTATQSQAREAGVADTSGDASATLAHIAQCESGGNPSAVSASGRYRGKYQFSRATWRAMGGSGDPAQAPEAEQDRIAAQLLAARGTSPWPSCA